MIEGMPARSAMAMPMGRRKGLGHNSVRKIATPMPIGTARIMARADVTKVPKIEGRPPNSLEVGSQALEVRKERPKALKAGMEPITSEAMTPAKIKSTAAAAA